ncbi:MAG: type IV pilus twitching motility protein PilT [Candidatus Electryoneaceae bacterium]|nr:type IV pilus twitching motility protein PilT [Candidatus Electryoneaceae bacterium]
MKTFEELLGFAVKLDASDLHMSTGSVPMIRVHGRMRKLNIPIPMRDEMEAEIRRLLTEDQWERFEEMKEIDLSYRYQDIARFRVNVFSQINGYAVAFRTIPSEIRGFEELALPEILKDLALLNRGLVIYTGPTGSGKSTSLAACIDFINEYKELHIITIEDPIEYYHHSRNCLINQRELGANTHSFANALRSALREDPDVILVGEMRDLETISLALTAAETGHLVFATLHTSSAAKTIDRIIDIFPASQKTQVRSMLAESLQAVVAQKLLVKKGGVGRVAACEVMVANTAVRNLIREDKIYQIPSVIQSGGKAGMQSLDQDLQRLLHKGAIDRETAAIVAENKKLFEIDLNQ